MYGLKRLWYLPNKHKCVEFTTRTSIRPFHVYGYFPKISIFENFLISDFRHFSTFLLTHGDLQGACHK